MEDKKDWSSSIQTAIYIQTDIQMYMVTWLHLLENTWPYIEHLLDLIVNKLEWPKSRLSIFRGLSQNHTVIMVYTKRKLHAVGT